MSIDVFSPLLQRGGRRALSFLLVVPVAMVLAGCDTKERTAEFYTRPENAAEFAEAFEACRISGLSKKDFCDPVWKAKFALDREEYFALIKRELKASREKEAQTAFEGGVSIVPQTPRSAPTPAPSRQILGVESVNATDPSASARSQN